MLDHKALTFLKVCACMNYTQAAQELHLTQPAVSKHIHALEEHYQVKLFQYNNKKLTLTEEGQFLYRVLSSMNHDALRLQDDIRQITNRKRIRLGATLSIGNYSMADRLCALMKNNPLLDVSVTVADTRVLMGRLDNGELDFILCEGNFKKDQYEFRLIRTAPMVFFVSADYDISHIRKLEDLFAHTIIVREQGSGTREIFDHYLGECGYSIDDFANYHEINNPDLILKVLASGAGFSVMYEDVGLDMLEKGILKAIPLEDVHLVHEFNAIWKKGSQFSEEYEKYLKELCG